MRHTARQLSRDRRRLLRRGRDMDDQMARASRPCLPRQRVAAAASFAPGSEGSKITSAVGAFRRSGPAWCRSSRSSGGVGQRSVNPLVSWAMVCSLLRTGLKSSIMSSFPLLTSTSRQVPARRWTPARGTAPPSRLPPDRAASRSARRSAFPAAWRPHLRAAPAQYRQT